ncbi:hypothetical protein A6D6_00354 [Alcanivorax xiamenensis]|uniref:DUF721 domain-containing protein n=1 Tax=Alcanivorax xiamenensis TaxID=1177156 RepID=A0ABQ6YCK6_9GAMM|nr:MULTISPECIES: hypothetical protein [Alcanivorax]KAF0807964.1 hypothetical protein A6D6_00354 [Alcanivorax xiamenensis]
MANTNRPQNLGALLKRHPRLGRLAANARAQPAPSQDRDPRACLPPALRDRVMLVEESQRWLALVENSTTAQLLRFHLPRLQRALAGAASVKIVVTGRRQLDSGPDTSRSPLDKGKYHAMGPVLDAESAAHIARAARDMDDPGLSEALARLASRVKK